MSKTREEYWMEEARKYESWFNRANYMRTQQEADNVALRELIGDMWTYITEPVSKRNNLKERLARLDDIGDRMRELGVEVDDGQQRDV